MNLTVTDICGETNSTIKSVTVKRPPVVLVHGFQSVDYDPEEIWKKMKARFEHYFGDEDAEHLPKLHFKMKGKDWCLNRPFVEIIPSATVLRGKCQNGPVRNNLTAG